MEGESNGLTDSANREIKLSALIKEAGDVPEDNYKMKRSKLTAKPVRKRFKKLPELDKSWTLV